VRIALVTDYYYPQLGGITEHVHGQATELTRRGHEVTVVTSKPTVPPWTIDGHPPPQGFSVANVGRGYPFYANGSETTVSFGHDILRRLDRVLAAGRFDVVHVHNPFGVALPAAAVARSRAAATVATQHSVFPHGYRLLRTLRRPARALLRRCDARIAVSAAVVDSVHEFFPALDWHTIPNGIDASFFSPEAEPIDRVDDRLTIVFVGRFDPRNGVKTMIGAYSRLRRGRDDVRLVIVGDGPLRPLIERMVPAELRADVVFAGRVNRHRPGYLTSADVLCTPTTLASFGMVLLEGMSAGLPVVASRLPGFELVMRDGVDGVMVDRPDDEIGFAAALDRMLDDPALRRRMGAAGRERALAAFAWPVVADRLEALYEDLLGRAHDRRALRRVA
jgi:phosphatidylinositol alpha-mannosyltransferase